MEFRAQYTQWSDGVSIAACEIDHTTGKVGFVAKPVEFMMAPIDFHLITPPTIELPSRAAQSLMTALWNAGVRPVDYKSTGAEVKRLEDHLADMRKLVFK